MKVHFSPDSICKKHKSAHGEEHFQPLPPELSIIQWEIYAPEYYDLWISHNTVLSSSPLAVDGLHLAGSGAGLNDDLRPRDLSRDAVLRSHYWSWCSVVTLDCVLNLIFTVLQVVQFMQNLYYTEYFSAEFQPQSESGKPPEYPKERRMQIGCQVEPKDPLFTN